MAFGFIFIVLGLLIKCGKLYMLLAGYNTMSAEKKANYNIKKATNLFMLVMLYMGVFIIVGDFISEWKDNEAMKGISFWTAILTGMTFLVWKANTKEYKFDKNK